MKRIRFLRTCFAAFLAAVMVFSVLFSLSGCDEKDEKDQSSALTSETGEGVSSGTKQSDKDTPSESYNSNTGASSDALPEDNRPEKVTQIYDTNISFAVDAPQALSFNDPKNHNILPYRLYLPKDYNKSEKYPVILFLHGAGELGNDNIKQINNISGMFKSNGDFVSKCILICPQTSAWWSLDNNYGDGKGPLTSAYNLLQDIMKNYSCDKNRIYLTGLSMGGYATWELLGRYPDTFAAAMPLCALTSGFSGQVYKNIPIRIYHGTADSTVPCSCSQEMYDKIIAAGGKKAEFIKLPGYDHNVWDYVYGNREAFSWLFSQNKATNPTMKYQKAPYFKVVDKNGKTVISDEDVVYYFFRLGHNNSSMDCDVYLSESGKASLAKAYESSKNGEFTVYFLDKKIYSFTANTPADDDLFVITGVFDAYNYKDYGNLLSLAMKSNNN